MLYKYFPALIIISSLLLTGLMPQSASAALTNQQKEACYERWAGRAQGAAGGADAKTFDEAAFKATQCAKQNTCKIERYEDGAVIQCYNTTTKKFDSENVRNRPSADPANANSVGEDKTPKNCGDITTNIIKCNTNGGDPVTSLLLQIINFLAVGVGIAVVGGIIWGGVLYASSNGDAAKVNQGKTTIVNSIIGLFLFIFMYAILNFIVPGGLFT